MVENKVDDEVTQVSDEKVDESPVVVDSIEPEKAETEVG